MEKGITHLASRVKRVALNASEQADLEEALRHADHKQHVYYRSVIEIHE